MRPVSAHCSNNARILAASLSDKPEKKSWAGALPEASTAQTTAPQEPSAAGSWCTPSLISTQHESRDSGPIWIARSKHAGYLRRLGDPENGKTHSILGSFESRRPGKNPYQSSTVGSAGSRGLTTQQPPSQPPPDYVASAHGTEPRSWQWATSDTRCHRSIERSQPQTCDPTTVSETVEAPMPPQHPQ